jgi:glutamate formiminotransferase/formiminotetrahydrofolate cyclodeaminase
MRLVECVPNFSEGRDRATIDAIADSVRGVDGVDLLDVDPGRATNRTVYTFVGEPLACAEAAFRAIRTAAERIDMRAHRGEHPRLGATDVVPFIPLAGTAMADCVELAKSLGRRVAQELGIPVYLYESAASRPERRNLSDIRAGEYEKLEAKLRDPAWAPDFGEARFHAKAGATVIGAREFLIAYNVDLNTRDRKLAQEIALTIREAGRAQRDAAGEIVRDAEGVSLKVPGTLRAVKAVGWVIDEYGRAQVSINLTDFKTTPLHAVFDECVRVADDLGVRVTGSEIVGLVPLEAMLQAGRHYLRRQKRSTGQPEARLVECAMQSLGLSDVSPFDPAKKIIEYRIRKEGRTLRGMTLAAFADELSTESPAPGGGSVASLCGAIAAALATMVGNLTHGRKGQEADWAEMERIARAGQDLKDAFLLDIDRDTDSFNAVLAAMRMPKNDEAEKAARAQAIEIANQGATLVPLGVLERSVEALRLATIAGERGNPNSVSDAGVAALCGLACAEGAFYNVRINLKSLTAPESAAFIAETSRAADAALREAQALSDRTRALVRERLG